ncbi:UvrD-like helicase family protein [Herbihabitans rhizosphaerae]|uniref:DNA 3'-5' helicase n=1 Tax=Herbihabitans rhizosphaerae TaxID=1872711 RepID=A0A4Q7KDC9_9PSEU|nr:UvrD-helicase domain-containing protein [Herbihabitans rhizosphaerae]RZS32205.1 UvrD-like helicase family protein [Herbihabitans rhizosphaerae]
MPRLSIDVGFLASYTKLQPAVRKAVDRTFAKFTEHTHAGLHLEKLNNARDPRIRTIRIDQAWRGVVLAPESGDEYVLMAVMHHDDANAFATSRRFSVNQAIGVLEDRNQQALDDIEPALRTAANATEERLFAAFRDKELTKLGVDADVLPLVRLLTSDTHLEALANLLPDRQYDALIGLSSGMTVEETWQELCAHIAEEPPEHIDTTDLTAAIERTSDRFAPISGPEELADILKHPFDVWRRFLHPHQRAIAYRPSFSGPALVTGGAGTGKTVTAIHRAAFLAKRLPPGDGQDILLTTYTNNLADSLADQVGLLLDGPGLDRIHSTTVNKLAVRIVTDAEGTTPDIINRGAEDQLWKSASEWIGLAFSPAFLKREWEQVILAQDLPHRLAYLACSRRGRVRPISQNQKETVWAAMTYALDKLRGSGRRTHLQVVAEAARILAERPARPYQHVLVDEGQDLHPVQWRLLRNAVPSRPDDLFIVSDPNQRIYNNYVSLARIGIEVRGRSNRLSLSYRTTHEILSRSIRILDGDIPVGLDDEPDALNGYRAQRHGARPTVRGFTSWTDELVGLTDQVRVWLDRGIEPHAIGVAARTNATVDQAILALDHADIPCATKRAADRIRVGTMHGMKGLEFRTVALVGLDDRAVPLPAAVTDAAEDIAAHAQDTFRERSLLFVACTRARDELYLSHSANPSPFLGT